MSEQINPNHEQADMIILRKQKKKLKKASDMIDRDNWALVERTRDIGKVPKGIYRICPCCMYPEKLKPEELEALMAELEGKIPQDGDKIIMPE